MKSSKLQHTRQRRGNSKRQRANDDGNLGMAVSYGEAGIPVVPMHGTDAKGLCTCGVRACGKPGKHPLSENGVYDASIDALFIEHFWKKWPWARIGIALGGTNNLVCLRIHGKAGRKSLRELTKRNGNLSKTVTIWNWDIEFRLFWLDQSAVEIELGRVFGSLVPATLLSRPRSSMPHRNSRSSSPTVAWAR